MKSYISAKSKKMGVICVDYEHYREFIHPLDTEEKKRFVPLVLSLHKASNATEEGIREMLGDQTFRCVFKLLYCRNHLYDNLENIIYGRKFVTIEEKEREYRAKAKADKRAYRLSRLSSDPEEAERLLQEKEEKDRRKKENWKTRDAKIRKHREFAGMEDL